LAANDGGVNGVVVQLVLDLESDGPALAVGAADGLPRQFGVGAGDVAQKARLLLVQKALDDEEALALERGGVGVGQTVECHDHPFRKPHVGDARFPWPTSARRGPQSSFRPLDTPDAPRRYTSASISLSASGRLVSRTAVIACSTGYSMR